MFAQAFQFEDASVFLSVLLSRRDNFASKLDALFVGKFARGSQSEFVFCGCHRLPLCAGIGRCS